MKADGYVRLGAKRALSRMRARSREEAYRRALAAVGFMPQTIDVLVERDRAWIERGVN